MIDALVGSLCEHLSIQSILCYGSYAQGLQDEQSDIDLLVLSKGTIATTAKRKAAYRSIKGLKIISMDNIGFSENWDNSWSPINDRVQIASGLVDIGYNKVSWVKNVLDAVLKKNQISCKAFPFRPYTFCGLLENCIVLADKDGFITKCQAFIRPMPKKLKKAIIDAFYPQLVESYEELVNFCQRDIGILAFQFILTRAIDAAIQLLFAVNDVYDLATKRIEPYLFKLKRKPPGLDTFLNKTLPGFFVKKHEVCQFIKELIQYIDKYK